MLQAKEILDAALQLPDEERALLVDELAASLHSGSPRPRSSKHGPPR